MPKKRKIIITVWDLSLDIYTNRRISFFSSTLGDVNYFWETIPAGQSGSGKFAANDSEVIIPTLPANATIKLNHKFEVNTVTFSPVSQASRDFLTKPVAQGGKGWVITGDMLSTEDCGLLSNETALNQSNSSLYPNPAQDKLFLKNALAGTAYKIIDGLGKEVNAGTFQNEEISIATLPAGLYTLLCGTRRFTFVKE